MSNGDGVFAPQEAPFARIFDIQLLISRRVISDYVATHGTSTLAGINFVDAGIKADPALVGDNLTNLPLMASEDLTTNIAQRVPSCTAVSPINRPPTISRPCCRST
jgi:hypothetical protein